jgi:hypothetical protein
LIFLLFYAPVFAAEGVITGPSEDPTSTTGKALSEDEPSRSRWFLRGGAYAHWNKNEESNGPPVLASLEYYRPNRWFYGIALFNNSFDQFSQFLFFGRQWSPFKGRPHVNPKLAFGVIQGYSGEHYDTLPIRWGGSWGLGMIPSIEYKKGKVGYEVSVLGVGGLLFSIGRDLN